WCFFPSMALRTGLEFFGSRISAPLYVKDYYEGVQYRNRQRDQATSMSLGVFAENDWQWARHWTLRTGARYDGTRLFEGTVYDTARNEPLTSYFGSPSGIVGLRGKWSQVSLDLHAARSFRIPQLTEMFGQSTSGNGVVYGNPDLRSEEGWTLDANTSFSGFWGQLDCSPFYWFLDNLISKTIRAGRGITYEYTNVDKAHLWGGEAQYTTPAVPIWKTVHHLSIGSSLVQADLDERPPWRILYGWNATWKPYRKIQADMDLSWNQYPGPGYSRLDMSLSATFPLAPGQPRWSASLTNVFDCRYRPHESLVPAMGRDLRTTVSFTI
ncbi:MAG TPA: TonB-dependent receptor, partial [Fibrobacteraceae bacterium]|nr:TonB-dependent receptor [Fibrobacteraceae bacterium]